MLSLFFFFSFAFSLFFPNYFEDGYTKGSELLLDQILHLKIACYVKICMFPTLLEILKMQLKYNIPNFAFLHIINIKINFWFLM